MSIFQCDGMLDMQNPPFSQNCMYRLRWIPVMTMKRRMLDMGVHALLRSRWCAVSGRKTETRLQSNSHSRATVLEESPLNKQLKADNEGASRQQGLGPDWLPRWARQTFWRATMAFPLPVRLKHQSVCICLCVYTELNIQQDQSLLNEPRVINETSGGKMIY